MDSSLAQGMCMECCHDLHDGYLYGGHCKGGLAPTPTGDRWFRCECAAHQYDYDKAGTRLVDILDVPERSHP